MDYLDLHFIQGFTIKIFNGGLSGGSRRGGLGNKRDDVLASYKYFGAIYVTMTIPKIARYAILFTSLPHYI